MPRLNNSHEQKVSVVEAIRNIEHGVSLVPERAPVLRGRYMDTNVINFLICDVLKEILRAFVRGPYSVLQCILHNVLSMQ
jgi:hypothetical protein